jgi:hypothetical protein
LESCGGRHTRGEVYARLLDKLETARAALGGRVYDVLGRLFEARALRELLMEAIRYGELPEVRAALFKAVDNAVDRQRIIDLLEERALARDTMDVARVAHIREEMERAAARRLQPHFIRSFFLEAFQHLGGRAGKREAGRWEVTRVPGMLRERDRQIGLGAVVLDRYERICFEKDRINEPPVASFVCPGHPLLDSTIDVILERYRDLLKRGAVLVDDNDASEQIRVLFYLEHAIQDGRVTRSGEQQVVSQRLQFVEINSNGIARDAGPAPYLDYRPISDDEKALISEPLRAEWLTSDIEPKVMRHAVEQVIPRHVEEVKRRRLPEIDKVEHEVTARLKREISYWDHRVQDLKAQERAGKTPRLNSANAEARANELTDRLQRRLAALSRERSISPLPPLIRGGAIVVPIGLIRLSGGDRPPPKELSERDFEIERLAMDAVIDTERQLGFEPRDVSAQKAGYDIESREPEGGCLRFIEVKGRIQGADTVTVTRNEILTALNKPDAFILAIVEVDNGFAMEPRYVRQPFQREPDFGANAVIYKLNELLARAEPPKR